MNVITAKLAGVDVVVMNATKADALIGYQGAGCHFSSDDQKHKSTATTPATTSEREERLARAETLTTPKRQAN